MGCSSSKSTTVPTYRPLGTDKFEKMWTDEDWKALEEKIGIAEGKNACKAKMKTAKKWLIVKTGDLKGAGTNSNVYLTLGDSNGNISEQILLDKMFHNDLEKGQADYYPCKNLPDNLGPIWKVELTRGSSGSDWFCDLVVLYDAEQDKAQYFPIHRWIKSGKPQVFYEKDTFLPQDDPDPEGRKQEIEEKRKTYIFKQKLAGLPVQVVELPPDEEFSSSYKFNMIQHKWDLLVNGIKGKLARKQWKSIDDVSSLYSKFEKTQNSSHGSYRDDVFFGAQRLVGCNPTSIQLCHELPECLKPVEDDICRFLEGKTVQQTIEEKRLFFVDHAMLKDIKTNNNSPLACPVALFYWTSKGRLLPVAIKLQQFNPEAPVFYPDDPKNTWTLVKMWFNHADSAVHQSNTHLAFTHLIMEGTCCSMHRNLSPSHPIFRFLSPHFLFLLAIDSHGLNKLINPGGWVDKAMTIGVTGMSHVIEKGIENWRMDVEGTLPALLEENGTLDPKILPVYGYAQDALLYFEAIKNYTTKIVSLYYDDNKKLLEDNEIQAWVKELATPIKEGGVGIQGLPGRGTLSEKDDLIALLTSVVFTCSIQHAAANFPQYDNYGIVANYPAALHGDIPTDKREYTETNLLDVHPTFEETLDTMTVTHLLSEKSTNSLGNWELQYQYDPDALQAEKQFRNELSHIGYIIDKRIKERENTPYQYDYLQPHDIPNAISI